ncbi:MAG TPA: alpha/beta hydrolase [Solirubrobacteraceae bacterium]|jgi:pimeloyl-ACP methyl ester carboxylesterase|nr:alpha/beta hydrolase [Solirubrobacteraceae bacterium]
MPRTSKPPQLFFEDRGDGDPLLLIVGFGASSAVFDPLADLWSTRFRCITYDHPGTGRSSKRACPVSTAGLAAAAVRVLDELEIDAAHVAGLSLGGAIAQELALRFPHRVRGLILVSTSTSGPLSSPPDPRKLASTTARIVKESVQRRRLWLGPAFFSDGFMEREPDRAEALMHPLTAYPAPPWSLAGQYLAAGLHDRALDLHRIHAPTLVLHGERDVLVPVANAELLARGIPNVELRIVPDGGHGFPVEFAAETFEIVCDWLDRARPLAGDRPTAGAVWTERLTHRLAVPLGALRFGRSSAVRAGRLLARKA